VVQFFALIAAFAAGSRLGDIDWDTSVKPLSVFFTQAGDGGLAKAKAGNRTETFEKSAPRQRATDQLCSLAAVATWCARLTTVGNFYSR
jgi:hypothetical protein